MKREKDFTTEDNSVPDNIESEEILARAEDGELSISDVNKLLNGLALHEFEENCANVMRIANKLRSS